MSLAPIPGSSDVVAAVTSANHLSTPAKPPKLTFAVSPLRLIALSLFFSFLVAAATDCAAAASRIPASSHTTALAGFIGVGSAAPPAPVAVYDGDEAAVAPVVGTCCLILLFEPAV